MVRKTYQTYASKIRINKSGYDSNGRYFGAGGLPVYLVDTGDASRYIRAESRAQAIDLACKPDADSVWGKV